MAPKIDSLERELFEMGAKVGLNGRRTYDGINWWKLESEGGAKNCSTGRRVCGKLELESEGPEMALLGGNCLEGEMSCRVRKGPKKAPPRGEHLCTNWEARESLKLSLLGGQRLNLILNDQICHVLQNERTV